MIRIANSRDLVAELRALADTVEASTQPSRADLAQKLASLSKRVALTYDGTSKVPLKVYVTSVEGEGIQIAFGKLPESLWADSPKEADRWLDSAISNLEKAKKTVSTLDH